VGEKASIIPDSARRLCTGRLLLKRKFGDAVRSKTDVAMKNEALCKFLCHNICVVIQSQCELGIEATFWDDEEAGDESWNILPLVRPN
jgi:hypothetical protein